VRIGEIDLSDRQASAQRVQLKQGEIERDAAQLAASRLATYDEQSVAQVEDFVAVNLVIQRFKPHFPNPAVALWAAVDPEQIWREKTRGWTVGDVELELRAKGQNDNVEVPSVRGRKSPAHAAGQEGAPQSRVGRQPRPNRNDQADQTRKPNEDSLVQAPPLALPRHIDRRSHAADGIEGLPRHRPPSIPPSGVAKSITPSVNRNAMTAIRESVR
jgi:hypothetical protein